MSKRFGRNQRRQMRAALATSQASHAFAVDQLHQHQRMMSDREARLKDEHAREIEAARTARDMIRIDIDSLVDERDRSIRMRARFENLSMRAEDLYSAVEIDPRQSMNARSDRERKAFLDIVGKQVAEHALAQIMRHWRSR